MKNLIFLDDERFLVDVTWINYNQEFKNVFVCRNFVDFTCAYDNDFKDIFTSSFNLKNYTFSFDHDIASFDENGYERTGLTCAKWLCDFIMDNNLDPKDLEYYVHSQNPVGAENIKKYIEGFKQNWSPM